MKTKIWSYGDEDRDFYDKKMLKAGSNHVFKQQSRLILLLKKQKTLSTSALKEGKYTEKEENVTRFIANDLETFYSDFDEE